MCKEECQDAPEIGAVRVVRGLAVDVECLNSLVKGSNSLAI